MNKIIFLIALLFAGLSGAVTGDLSSYFTHFDVVELHETAGLHKRSLNENMKIQIVYREV